MRRFQAILTVALALWAFAFLAPTHRAQAGAGFGLSTDIYNNDRTIPTYYANSPAGDWVDWNGVTHHSGTALRKFVDELPPVGCGKNGAATTNGLGQCLPIAEANTPYLVNGQAPYPGSDYYEIAIVEYREQMHSDLPQLVEGVPGSTPPSGGTKIRGYVQIVPQGYISPVTGLAAVPLDMAHGLTEDVKDANGNQVYGMTRPHYMGPVIVTQEGTPVRVKYTNLLPVGNSGDLFIPVDHTLMGAGKGYLQDPSKPDSDPANAYYTDNRTAVHLHGGDTPWISDGTPNQWLVPAAETTQYETGASLASVPDMPVPAKGTGTLYYTNDISGRLMFYHDHAVGITRLNVYAGMAAGYEIQDPEERALTANPGGVLPVADEIPLVIQDKTFVPQDIGLNGAADLASCTDGANSKNVDSQDCKWSTTHWGGYGDLWYPNVYEFNQDLSSYDGTNPVGRWDYGPYFWPIFPVAADHVPYMTDANAGTWGHASTTPEAYGDTPIVNGTAYPTMTVQPKAYRFRILNASNDKFFNLGLYLATQTVSKCVVNSGGSGYDPATTTVSFSGGQGAVQGASVPDAPQAAGTVTVDPSTGAVTGITLTNFGSSYVSPPTVTISGSGTGATASCALSGLTEMAMVPFDSSGTFPATGGLIGSGWGTPDSRVGGIPSPATVGPDIIAIGNEGGLLPAPVDIPSTPVNYEYNKRSVTVLNVFEHGLYIAAAERTDIIVDFSQFAGKTLILYNDCPSPTPAGDPRIDYYTGDPDFTSSGGAATTLPGYGPNTRTVMQIKVANTTPDPAITLGPLTTAIASAYKATQPAPIVWEPRYQGVYPTPQDVDPTSTAGPWPTHAQYATIRTGSLVTPTFNFIAGSDISYYPYNPFTLPLTTTTTPTLSTTRVNAKAGEAVQMPVQSKAIQELFDFWGRMNATLGAELPFTNANTQTTVPLGYTDPAVVDPVTGDITEASLEKIQDGETQIWKITHNGVDTHPVHIHLVNLQLINRVGWDGTIKAPDANEIGWKETIKMNPLEDVIVAVRANAPNIPFGIPTSSRYISPSEPPNSTTGFTGWDPLTGNAFAYNNGLIENRIVDLGWEYVWHCHILGHEENDFMRPFVFVYPAVAPAAPTNLSLQNVSNGVQLTWGDTTPVDYTNHSSPGFGNFASEIGYTIERSENGAPFAYYASAVANATTFTDTNVTPGTNYLYQVKAYNSAGTSGTSNIAALVASGVRMSAPTAGAVFLAPATINLQAATGPGITSVSYYNGATLIGTSNGPAPFTVSWTPVAAGNYTLTAVASDGTTSATSTAVNITVAGPATGVAITNVNPASPTTWGSSVNLNFSGQGGSGSYEYQVKVYEVATNTWTLVRDYSTTPSATWNTGLTPAGDYRVRVNVRNAGSVSPVEAFGQIAYLTFVPTPATGVTITSVNPASPTTWGNSLTLNYSGQGGSGFYEYQVKIYEVATHTWTLVQDYSITPSATWNTGLTPAGDYRMRVNVRSLGSLSPVEAYSQIPYLTLAQPPATGVTITSVTPASPTTRGNAVNLTYSGQGGSGSYEYQVKVYEVATHTWTLVQDYSTTPSATWNTALTPAGDYRVRVNVRNVGSLASVEAYSQIVYFINP